MIAVVLGVAVRLAVGGLLAVAGTGKLLSGRAQREKWLSAYRLVPPRSIALVAFLVPVAELLAGAALLLGFGGRLSIVMSGSILGLITAAAAGTLARGLRPDCGCFGRWAREQLSWRIVLRNTALIGLLALLDVMGLAEPGVGGLSTTAQAMSLVILTVIFIGVPGIAVTALRRPRTMPALSPAPTEA